MSQRHPIQNDVMMFITTNVASHRPLFKNAAYAREAIDCLYRTQELYPFFLYGFAVMPDHCHFLMMVPSPGHISDVIRCYKRSVSHAISIGSIWQPRFHMRMPENSHPILHYIHQNPVKAGLCENTESYPWSSASGKWDVTELDIDLS